MTRNPNSQASRQRTSTRSVANRQRPRLPENVADSILVQLDFENEFTNHILEIVQKTREAIEQRDAKSLNLIAEKFKQLNEKKSRLTEMRDRTRHQIASLKPMDNVEPIIRNVINRFDQRDISEISAMRKKILASAQEIQSIGAANQAILIHGVNFYQKMFAVLTGSSEVVETYDEEGILQSDNHIQLFRKNC